MLPEKLPKHSLGLPLFSKPAISPCAKNRDDRTVKGVGRNVFPYIHCLIRPAAIVELLSLEEEEFVDRAGGETGSTCGLHPREPQQGGEAQCHEDGFGTGGNHTAHFRSSGVNAGGLT